MYVYKYDHLGIVNNIKIGMGNEGGDGGENETD